MNPAAQTFSFRICPIIPDALIRLNEIASDLWFTWNSNARALYRQMDEELWTMCGHNPKMFLRRVKQERLSTLARDRYFMAQYHRVISDFDEYKSGKNLWFAQRFKNGHQHHIAYFSAEFGMNESLPIYSGGLGILAGDHCKSASDLGLPFTAVGLLYRQGYFTQQIDNYGNQLAIYRSNRFEDLCITAAKDEDGSDLMVSIDTPDGIVQVKIWIASAGNIRMVLLDTDVESNSPENRSITNQLYGGGVANRIRQEIVLGIGGVRALQRLGISPTVWHANEGHAAFVILERLRNLVQTGRLTFDEALEMVRAATVFTTHTPVPAGHDVFPYELFDRYMAGFAADLGISLDQLHALGYGDFGHGSGGFNQTALAIHGAAYINGVAKLHGEVSSRMFRSMWPDLMPEDNPVASVTNGIHVGTWLAPTWELMFDHLMGSHWRGQLLETNYWKQINAIPDEQFWSTHQTNKLHMLQYVRRLLEAQARRNGESSQNVQRMVAHFDVRTLVIGFARRFATYKRATLLFRDEKRLLELLDSVKRPVIFLFAGKAHPADEPGKALIRRVHEISRKPEFIGRVLMLEGYDMTLARYLVSGVDVWLNNPVRPLEASGTSGMKAAINGIPNLSVLDGWWPEGYRGNNGWAIGGEHVFDRPDQPLEVLDSDDSESLYLLLKDAVIPSYYRRNESAYSEEWVAISKQAMISSIPLFNTDRMVSEYCDRIYITASNHGKALMANDYAEARAIAAWKQRVRAHWHTVQLRLANGCANQFEYTYGQKLPIRIVVDTGQLTIDDIRAEVLVMRPSPDRGYKRHDIVAMQHRSNGEFEANLQFEGSGEFIYQIRIYPTHLSLAHPRSMGIMKYL